MSFFSKQAEKLKEKTERLTGGVYHAKETALGAYIPARSKDGDAEINIGFR